MTRRGFHSGIGPFLRVSEQDGGGQLQVVVRFSKRSSGSIDREAHVRQ